MIINHREKGALMKLAALYAAFRKVTWEILRINDFNYQLPKDINQDYWAEECIDHPTISHCKVYKIKWVVGIQFINSLCILNRKFK